MSVQVRAAREIKVVMSDAGRRALRKLGLDLSRISNDCHQVGGLHSIESVTRDAADLLDQLADGDSFMMVDADAGQSAIVIAPPPAPQER
jgi:hypothetical protein